MTGARRDDAVALVRGSAGGPPALDLAVTRALLRGVASRRHPDVLRIYAPEPTLAFGRLDALRPGFGRAADAARSHGFAPVIRVAGGHAAAYHGGCVVVDEITFDPDALTGMRERFQDGGAVLASVLRGLGADARVGQIPGEYCPGEFSVNAGGRIKLAGSAQRVVRDAWLSSTVVVVTGAEAVRETLADVYAALEMSFARSTAGALEDEVPGATVTAVAERIAEAHEHRRTLVPAELDAAAVAQAETLLARHRVSATAATAECDSHH